MKLRICRFRRFNNWKKVEVSFGEYCKEQKFGIGDGNRTDIEKKTAKIDRLYVMARVL